MCRALAGHSAVYTALSLHHYVPPPTQHSGSHASDHVQTHHHILHTTHTASPPLHHGPQVMLMHLFWL